MRPDFFEVWNSRKEDLMEPPERKHGLLEKRERDSMSYGRLNPELPGQRSKVDGIGRRRRCQLKFFSCKVWSGVSVALSILGKEKIKVLLSNNVAVGPGLLGACLYHCMIGYVSRGFFPKEFILLNEKSKF